MSYELRHGETLGDNLCRVCRKQIEGAIAVAKGETKTDDTPVHAMRKHLKKARAALRLVRKEIGRGLYRTQDHALRDVGRRSEEHTSELQSPYDLVCRLLLEKKKKMT